jgi:hypothetical protein
MALELVGIVAGGSIGLLGGLGGVFLDHFVSRKRDAATRATDGLRLVVNELNRLSRLGLCFEQQNEIGLRESDIETFAGLAIAVPDWLKATHELQETNWRFLCMAYLPEAMDDFRELNHLMGCMMDPYARTPTETDDLKSEQAREKFKAVHSRIQDKVESRLKQLL